jgi:hypothetical protein
MEMMRDPPLRKQKFERALVEEVSEASDENAGQVLNQIYYCRGPVWACGGRSTQRIRHHLCADMLYTLPRGSCSIEDVLRLNEIRVRKYHGLPGCRRS